MKINWKESLQKEPLDRFACSFHLDKKSKILGNFFENTFKNYEKKHRETIAIVEQCFTEEIRIRIKFTFQCTAWVVQTFFALNHNNTFSSAITLNTKSTKMELRDWIIWTNILCRFLYRLIMWSLFKLLISKVFLNEPLWVQLIKQKSWRDYLLRKCEQNIFKESNACKVVPLKLEGPLLEKRPTLVGLRYHASVRSSSTCHVVPPQCTRVISLWWLVNSQW